MCACFLKCHLPVRTFKSVIFVFFLSLKFGGGASQTFTPAAWSPHLCSLSPAVAIRRWCAGGMCRFRGNSSNRNHSATGSLSIRTWVFLQTRISVPVFSPFRQWSQRGHARTACFAISDNFGGRLEALLRITVAWICRNGCRGHFASCHRQETTSNTSGCSGAQHVHDLSLEIKNKGDYEQPEGRRDGIEGASVWAVDVVLHKGEGRASAKDLPLTPVVAAGPTVWTFRILAGTHTVGFCVVYFESIDDGGGGLLGFLHSSSCLFTGRRRLCLALTVWRSASWLIIPSSEQFKFATVINNNLSGAG